MDPLCVQMVMGSPPAKINLSKLIGRKKSSPGSEGTITPKTPTKPSRVNESSHATPTRHNTVRMRRGFRPLSVMTNSVFESFEFNALRAMETLQDNKDISTGPMDDAVADDDLKDATNTLADLPFSNESEISLKAFLKQPHGPQEVVYIRGSFSDLQQIPAPDDSQHPAFSATPFSSQSDAPSLITTSSLDEIKDLAARARSSSSRFTDRTSNSSIFGSAERRKLIFFDKLQSPGSVVNRASTSSAELSPLAKRHVKSRPIEVTYTTPNDSGTDVEKKRSGSAGLRKFSDLFKSRVASERTDSSSQIEVCPSPNAVLRDMEIYLRKVTCSPTYQYSDTSWLPRHPNTGRFWRSRNLKCTNCIDVCCACCGRTCCAYKAAAMALETHKDNPQGRDDARQRLQQITMVFPYGRELPTFLRCTAGTGNGAGCGKLVCPDCCGVCPDEVCSDIQCRKCKKNPWAECEWHVNLGSTHSLGDAVSVRHTV